MRDPDDFLVSRLRFKHLALVEALDRLGSIRKAAQAIHVSEPAVSKSLTEVEASFGFALFERSPAGVTSTERGRVVIEGARLLLNSLRHVRVAAANAEAVLPLRLGANSYIAQTYFPQLVSALWDQIANFRLEVREGAGPQLFQMLRQGDIDAALLVISYEDIAGRGVVDLAIRTLYNEALVVIAPKGHPMASRGSISWRDLAREQWILPPPRTPMEISIRNAFLSEGVAPPIPRILSSAPYTNVRLVSAGLGISAVPSRFANTARATVAIDVVRVKPHAQLPPVSLVFRAAAAEEAGIRALIDAVDRVMPK
jgi:DNA-binding transcriptional LysR family regulator